MEVERIRWLDYVHEPTDNKASMTLSPASFISPTATLQSSSLLYPVLSER